MAEHLGFDGVEEGADFCYTCVNIYMGATEQGRYHPAGAMPRSSLTLDDVGWPIIALEATSSSTSTCSASCQTQASVSQTCM